MSSAELKTDSIKGFLKAIPIVGCKICKGNLIIMKQGKILFTFLFQAMLETLL